MKYIKYLCIISLLTVGNYLSARTLYVNKSGDDTNNGLTEQQAFLSFNKAFLYLKDGDTIRIDVGTYTITSTLEWNGSLHILGAGADKTIIQASESMIKNISSVFVSSIFHQMKSDNCDGHVSESEISGLTIRNGTAPISEIMPTGVGGGIKNFAKLLIKDCILENNVALNGGAIYNDGNLTVGNTTIRNNHAFNRTGAIYNTSQATYTDLGNVIIENNTEDNIYNTTFLINDFENGFYAGHGTNGNNEGGYAENSPNFTIVDNPDLTGINKTAKVGKFTRKKDGDWWAYAWFEFSNTDIQYVPMYLHIMIRKPINSTVCIQVKDSYTNPVANTKEIVSNAQSTVDEWQDMVFEIPVSGLYCYLEVKPDFVNAVTSTRLTEDIDIYFDEIVINGSPTPRSSSEGKLGEYIIPTGTASFEASNVSENVNFSDLTYTNNLTYDYNLSTGYFRPFKWSETEKDPEKYLEFKVTPQNDVKINISKLKIVHKPNTATLGPSKMSVSYSTNNGETFTDLPEITIASRTSFNTDVIYMNELNTNQQVIFRLYAYESLYGTSAQKDFWIIDNIELYGSVDESITQTETNRDTKLNCTFLNGNLSLKGISKETTVSVFNVLGKKLLHTKIYTDTLIPINTKESFLIVNINSGLTNQTIKVVKQ